MGHLAEVMLSTEQRKEVVDDYVRFIHDTVAGRGFAVRTAYAAFRRMKNGHVEESVELLLPGFMEVLDSHYGAFLGEGQKDPAAFPAWIKDRAGEVAADLLEITDTVMADSGKPGLQKLYGMIRGAAHKHVAEAIPGMASVAARRMAL